MRKNCRSCGSTKLIDILSLGNQYLSDFREDDQKPPAYPLDLILCEECMLVQLKETTPANLLYTERYGFKSGINNTIKLDLSSIASNALLTAQIEKGDIVIDIGANDGTLLSNYPSDYEKIAVEPVTKLAEQAKAHANHVVNDFFSYNAVKAVLGDRKAKIITSISMFYDLEDPNSFVEDIKKCLADDGLWVIQQNYLVGMLTQNAFDNICHEHLEYYSLLSLENLLKRHDMEVYHVELNDVNGGSFRTYIRRSTDKPTNSSVEALRMSEKLLGLDTKKPYLAFGERITKNGQEVKEFIQQAISEGKKVYLYGASTRGNTLLQWYKLDQDSIPFAIERNPEKFGKKIASVGIPIISEEQARGEKPDYFLILPWFFVDEFVKREQDYLNGGGKFIVPLPQMKIIGKED